MSFAGHTPEGGICSRTAVGAPWLKVDGSTAPTSCKQLAMADIKLKKYGVRSKVCRAQLVASSPSSAHTASCSCLTSAGVNTASFGLAPKSLPMRCKACAGSAATNALRTRPNGSLQASGGGSCQASVLVKPPPSLILT